MNESPIATNDASLSLTDNTAIKGIRVRQDNGTQAELLSQLNENAHVYQTFAEVMHMLKPPTAFFQPRILAQVLWWLMKGKSVSSPSSNWQTLPKLLTYEESGEL